MYKATLYYRDIRKALKALENLERLADVTRKEFHKGHITVTLAEDSVSDKWDLFYLDRWASTPLLWDETGYTILQGIVLSKSIESKLSLKGLNSYLYSQSNGRRKKPRKMSLSMKIGRLLQCR